MKHDGQAKTCHFCPGTATGTWQRAATTAEATAYFDALEQSIRESGSPEYVQDRTSPVTQAVQGCAVHAMPAGKAAMTHAANCAGPGACQCPVPAPAAPAWPFVDPNQTVPASAGAHTPAGHTGP